MAIWYVDLEGSAGSADGTSFANRSSDIAAIINAASNSDVVRIKATPDPVSIGSVTWTHDSTLTLPAGTIKDIYNGGIWTAATNVTPTNSTSPATKKSGTAASSLAIAAGFTTGRVAHFGLGSAQDFSGYQKISFWIRTNAAVANANIYNIRLCSDTGGTTAVNTLTLPSIPMLANTWVPISIDNGAALGSSIQSIALYASTDPGTVTVLLSNIFATNAVTLRTLIGKYTSLDDPWYAIRSIEGTTLTIDQSSTSSQNIAAKGFAGTTETVTSYVSDGVMLAAVAAAASNIYTLSKTAVSGAEVLVSGGWNRTDMSTQTERTHMCAQNHLGRIFNLTGGFLTFERLLLSHSSQASLIAGDGYSFLNTHFVGHGSTSIGQQGTTRTSLTVTNCTFNNCTIGYNAAIRRAILTNCLAHSNGGDGFAVSGNFSEIIDSEALNNTGSGVFTSGGAGLSVLNFSGHNNAYGVEFTSLIGATGRNISATGNATAGLFVSTSDLAIYGLTTSGNNNISINDGGAAGARVSIFNWVKDEATAVANLSDYDGGRYVSVNDGGTADNHVIYTDGGRISSDTSVRHTASGISWKLQPTSNTRSAAYPLSQALRGVPVKAGVEHTASVWVRRDDTGLSLSFELPDQDVAGITAQSVPIAASADVWEKLSIVFTPTIDAVIDFRVSAYGGTTFTGYWDDFEVVAASKNDASSGDLAYPENGVYVTNAPAGGGESTSVFC